MLYNADRRRAARQPRQDVLFIQITVDTTGPTRRTVRCRAADVSGSGLRVTLDEPVSKGTGIDLWIRLDDLARNYLLRGRVRWSDPARCEAGIAIVGAAGTDYWEWQSLALG